MVGDDARQKFSQGLSSQATKNSLPIARHTTAGLSEKPFDETLRTSEFGADNRSPDG